MKKLFPILICVIFLTLFTKSDAQTNTSYLDIRTPFAKVIYKNNHPYIQVNGDWVKLVSIQDQAIEKIIKQAVDTCPKDWKRCFHQHWAYMMDELKIIRQDDVKVGFIQNGNIIFQSFKLKEENGKLADRFHYSQITKNSVDRKRSRETPEHFKYLTKRLDGFLKLDDEWLTPKQAIHDLEYLEWEIATNYSYADLRGFNYSMALDAIVLNLKDGISKRDFAYQLKMLMANFGDGHSRVSIKNVKKSDESRWLPFEIIKHDEKYYAVDPNTKSFFHSKLPQIEAINDIEIDSLFQISKELVTKSNLKAMTRDAMSYLNYTAFALKLAGEKDLKNATITFSDGLNKEAKVFNFDKYKMPRLIKKHKLKDTILNNNIGYIALNEHMYGTDGFIDSIHLAMQNVKNTNGLIIDIRNNGGGKRAPLIAFLSYFIKETKITNVAKFRINRENNLQPQFGYLEGRNLFPLNINEDYFNNENEHCDAKDFKTAILKAQASFNPAKLVDNEKFSEYHYMAVSPIDPNIRYYYKQPVIVLIDEGCFSASDIFAAGIRQGDNVRLLGNTTQGGSGYSKGKYLPNSGLKVKLSRMFSYQPDGNLYDTHGVVPDIYIDYTLEDKMGLSDSQLEAAIFYLRNEN